MLYVVPGRRAAVALVANGGDTGGLIRAFAEPLVEEVAEAELSGPVPAAAAAAELDRYTGVYANGTQRITVSAQGDGLVAAVESTGDAAAMVARAGLSAEVAEIALRAAGPGVFVTGTGRYAQFLDAEAGPARFFHFGGRSVPRAV
ncbi:hypothetical protein [Glycomyces terrestris]|uniref:Uncharacterized protein n=1 Tax=Glycomyces terrestris TaxID=2493553 RepID=A0A426UT62_9ACTN|nr:hypothetical protein [Glycomyces terrestris]RRR96812.1 hypothetical protein EIW28_20405 [Glycomyces terrestris]